MKGGKRHEKETVVCAVYHDMHDDDSGMWTKENPEKKKSEKAEQEETEFKDRESLKLSLFTVYYPKAWNYDKENMKKDEEYSYVRFFDGDTADGSENVISIRSDQGEFIYISKEFNCLWSGFRGIC